MAESLTSKDPSWSGEAKRVGRRLIWGNELLSGQETTDKGMENNKTGWKEDGREGKWVRGKRRLEKTKVKRQRETKIGGETVAISGSNHEIPADSSWLCARDSLPAVD